MRIRLTKKIICIFCVAALIATLLIILDSKSVEAYSPSPYSGTMFSSLDLDTYVDSLSKDVVRPNDEIVIDAKDDFTEKPLTEDNEHTDVYHSHDESGLYIPETVEITYNINVAHAGYYNIKIRYFNVTGRNSSICKGIKINGEYQFKEAESFNLSRSWVDEFDVSEKRKDGHHDFKPSQIEKNQWSTLPIKDNSGAINTPYLFYFNEGINTITFTPHQEPVVFGNITLYQEEDVKSYQEVYNDYLERGFEKKSEGLIETKIQAESAYEKSSPSLSPVANYSSFKVEPYVKFITRYNTIGAANWDIMGDYISFELNVKEAGLYHITIKSLQNYNHGKTASRRLYLNGVVPFSECECIDFKYNSDWQNVTLGDSTNGAYWFYLNKGSNILKLENVIGKYASTTKDIETVITSLNWIYRKVIMRTGVNPSKYHDFNLKDNIDGLYDEIDKCIELLNKAINAVVSISGERSDLIGSLERTKYQLDSFKESEKKIQTGLSELETNITSLGTWIQTVTSQPLSLDYIVVHGDNVKLPKATTNFFQKIANEFILLIGSYKADTSLKSSITVDGPTIEVWIMTGRDQSNLLRQLIDESFTVSKNINVNLKLVSAAVLLPATLSGNGPDVAIGVGQSIPVNWGIRGAVVDMSKLDGFDEYVNNFYPSAVYPFNFDGSTYALPDTQDFLIQFVRTDIFRELELVGPDGSIVTPTTWDEVIDLLPVLQRQYLDYYIPNVTGALSPLMYAMIKQYGGELYLDNGKASNMLSKESSNAFYDFVNFYNNYGFQVDASFVNRFRTGEMPIGITNYSLYNTLSVSAPEIRGNWDFSLLPGKQSEHGINSSTTSTSTGTIILSDTLELDASWEFVKWWLSDTAQTGYATGIEAILGAAARYPTANINAFKNLPWSARDYRILDKQRSVSVGVPVVPGDYIVGRYIDNAFRKVLNDGINPSDALFTYHQKINAELTRKRKEFNLD